MSINKVVAFIAILTFFGSTYAYIDTHYASAADLQAVASRLDFKILNDKRTAVQKDLWAIEDRYENRTMPSDTKDKLRKLKVQQKDLDATHDAMIKESIKR